MRLGLRPDEALPPPPYDDDDDDDDDDDVAIRRYLDGSHVLPRLLPQVEIGPYRIGTSRVRLVSHPPDRSHMRGDVVLPHGGGETHTPGIVHRGVRDARGNSGDGDAHGRGVGDDTHHEPHPRRFAGDGQRRS